MGTYLLPNSTKYGPLNWMNISSDYHWEVLISNVTVGSTPISLSRSRTAVLDTGSSLSYLPLAEYS